MSGKDSKKYFIFVEGDDIMFVMNVPPDELDHSVIDSFKEEIRSRGLDGIILPNVEDIIKNSKQGDVVKIGGTKLPEAVDDEPEPEVEEDTIKPEDLPFAIEVTPDAMQALLRMEDPSVSITRSHIDVGLESVGIRYGVIEMNIEEIIAEWPKLLKVLIAEGTNPEDGMDAELELVKELKKDLAPQIQEDGLVDFKQLNLISPILQGEVLQIRTPPTPGMPGSDVFGKKIEPNPGKDRKLQKGLNTETSEDGSKLVSTHEGFLHMGSRGEINVRPVYTVTGDVDYSTGNVEYKSDVLIKGDVRGGFSVTAGGDVHIYGAVEDAVIEAEGDISIKGGVLSSGLATITAGGDISVGFMQNARVQAGGSVYIRIEAIGSRIKAGRDVEVMKREGRIVGGELVVGGWVVAGVIGSENCPVLRIRFYCIDDSKDDDQIRYKYSFVSTRSLDSPIKVFYGKLMANVSGIEPPLTISRKDERIVIENYFMDQDKLKKLRKERKTGDKNA